MEEKQRIYLWDNLKVLLMFFVVVAHCIYPYLLNNEKWVSFLWIFILTFTMPLFTLMSGFFYKKRSIKYSVERFLYPCILFSILNYSIAIPLGCYPNGISLKSGYAMWYIWVLFIYYNVTPFLLSKMNEKYLLFLSFAIAFICGFKFIPDRFLDSMRIVSFYPFFVLGIVMKKNNLHVNSKIGILLMGVCFIIYFSLTQKFSGFSFGANFKSMHGLNSTLFFVRWLNYLLTIVMSISLIAVMPNKKLWFSQFGTRTMNVYLLHMAVVIPICWILLKPYMSYWFGYVLYIMVVPLLLSACLFSEFIDKKMQVVLSMPQRIWK